MKRQVPKMTTDAEAEAFLESDLSDLDFTQFKSARFQFTSKIRQQEERPAKQTSVASRALPGRLAPGTPAPHSGIYEQRGPRGGHTGQETIVTRGNPLPPTPSPGHTWTLVEAPRRKGEEHGRQDGHPIDGERGRKREK